MASLDTDRIPRFIERYRVAPGSRIHLPGGFDPGDTAEFKEEDAERVLAQGIKLLADYQARLAAQDKAGLLVIIQAMDAAGKDGTISHVMSGVNPQGVSVTSFKAPSPEEADHDFLWRPAKALPGRGMIAIFNRSYYEECLIVRVHPGILAGQRLPEERKDKGVWTRRFRHINAWESYLVDQGFSIVKIFLNVSKDEQRRRFLDRINEPDKNWKFGATDVKERGFWDAYQAAYSDVLARTSTKAAPWYAVPADNKWFARITTAAIIAQALIDIDPQFPVVSAEAKAALMTARQELLAEDATGGGGASRSAPAAAGVAGIGAKKHKTKGDSKHRR